MQKQVQKDTTSPLADSATTDKHDIESAEQCYHCGEACGSDALTFDDKPFCCTGCKTVYELLSDGGLCDYYSFEERLQQPLQFSQEGISEFSYLDHAEIKSTLLDFASEELEIVTLHLPQIHCASCLWLLENLNRLQAGIIRSEVNFLQKQVHIRYSPKRTSLRAVAELLTRIGYKPAISLDKVGKKEKKNAHLRPLIMKIALAGFAFGNIMLLSVPDYLAGGDLDEMFAIPFIIINVILATPVVVYSAWDYYKASYLSLKEKEISVDIPVAIGILAIYFRSLYDVTAGVGTGYFDSLVGLVFFLLIGKLVQRRTFDALTFERDYRSYFPLAATLLDGGSETTVPVTSLKPDDIILVRHNEIVPADSLLLSDSAVFDYSFVTGESRPQPAYAGESVYAGARVVGASIRIHVRKEVSRSYLTRLWNNETFTKEKRSSLAEFSSTFGKYFTIITFFFAFLGAYLHIEHGGKAVEVFTAVLIIACPCAYTLAAPFAFGTLQQFFGKHGFYLKNPEVVSELSLANSIIFDKTGTLTTDSSDISFVGEALSSEEKNRIAALAKQSAHPLSRDIASQMGNKSLAAYPVSQFAELTGKGIKGEVLGKSIVLGSRSWLLDNGVDIPTQTINEEQTAVYVAIDGAYRGTLLFANTFRPGIAGMFERLSTKFSLSLLSGDGDSEAKRLGSVLPPSTPMLFRKTPQDKLEYVKEQKEQGRATIMVGDGLNDAGALKQSTVGIAVTDNVSLFSPASDAILAGEKLAYLPDFIDAAGQTVRVVYLGFVLSLLYNIVGLYFAMSGQLTPLVCAILMPVSSLSVIGVAVFGATIVASKKKFL